MEDRGDDVSDRLWYSRGPGAGAGDPDGCGNSKLRNAGRDPGCSAAAIAGAMTGRTGSKTISAFSGVEFSAWVLPPEDPQDVTLTPRLEGGVQLDAQTELAGETSCVLLRKGGAADGAAPPPMFCCGSEYAEGSQACAVRTNGNVCGSGER